MRVFVTGGGGFLGRTICRQLIDAGHEVVAFQRNESEVLKALGIEQRMGSICSKADLFSAMSDCDAVIHTAAKAGVWGSAKAFYDVNFQGTKNVTEVAQSLGVGLFVHTSTPSVVFNGESFAGADERLPYGKNWLCEYARTKALAESYVLGLNDNNGFRVCALRPHLIWGEGDPHLAPALLEAGRKRRLKVIGDGQNRVDVTHVENAARAHVLALQALLEGKAGGQAYFLSDDSPVNLWDWVNELFRKEGLAPLDKKISLTAAYRIGAVLEVIWKTLGKESNPPMTRFVAVELAKDHWFSVEKAKRDLGYGPRVYSR